MKNKLKRLLYSDGFVIVGGMIVVPLLSFILISISPESPLYTPISRIAWVHHLWPATFVWAVIVMGVISWLTYRMVYIINNLSIYLVVMYVVQQFICRADEHCDVEKIKIAAEN